MKKVLKLIVLYFTFLAILISISCIVNLIPRSVLKDNFVESVNYIEKKSLSKNCFYYLIDKLDCSLQDGYADLVLMNIIYNFDNKSPLKSFMYSKYYVGKRMNALESFKDTLTDYKNPNKEYLRYYHGSMIFLKPLFVLFSLNEIIILINIIAIILLSFLIKQLWKYKDIIIIMIVSLIVSNAYFGLFSLEYAGNILLMLLFANICVYFEKNNKDYYSYLFLISGLITCFTDFLTTETLTFLFPISLVILIRCKDKKFNFKENLLFVIKMGVVWFTSYTITWFSKWIISSIILNINSFNYVTDRAAERMYGLVNKNYFYQIIYSILKNVLMLIPFVFINKYDYRLLVFAIFVLFIFSFYFIFKKNDKDHKSLLLFLLGCIPILRLSLLSNHGYIHYFFSYRALIPTVMLWIYALYYGTDWKEVKKYVKRKK